MLRRYRQPGKSPSGKPRALLAWSEFPGDYVYTRHLSGGILCFVRHVFSQKMDTNVPACVQSGRCNIGLCRGGSHCLDF